MSEGEELQANIAPEVALRLRAKVMFLYGNTTTDIARELNVDVRQVRAWSTSERWDRARAAVMRTINDKILRGVQRQYGLLVNDQFQKLQKLKKRLWDEIEGIDPADPTHRLPGQLLVGDGEAAIGLLLKLMSLEKDLTLDTLGLISDAMPKLDPRDVDVARVDNDEEG